MLAGHGDDVAPADAANLYHGLGYAKWQQGRQPSAPCLGAARATVLDPPTIKTLLPMLLRI